MIENSEDNNIDNSFKDNRDFLEVLKDYKLYLSNKQYKNFIKRVNKERAKYPNIQFFSEVAVVNYIMRNYAEEFKYEPNYNGKKNPECSFKYKGRTINIEVKCPDYTNRTEQESGEKLNVQLMNYFPHIEDAYDICKKIGQLQNREIEIIKPIDNKLKDYLESSNEKFPDSGTSYFNILVIALNKISDMDEWYNYLFGYAGAFTTKPHISVDYSRIDAVLLTNLQYGHDLFDIDHDINPWYLENYFSFLLLNPCKEYINGLSSYYSQCALDIFGHSTRKFLCFLKDCDAKYINEYINKDIYYIRSTQLISEFLRSQCQHKTWWSL